MAADTLLEQEGLGVIVLGHSPSSLAGFWVSKTHQSSSRQWGNQTEESPGGLLLTVAQEQVQQTVGPVSSLTALQ